MSYVNSLFPLSPILKREIVDTPELGEGAQVIISEMPAIAASDFNRDMLMRKGTGEDVKTIIFMCRLICCCALKEDGTMMMDIKDAESLSVQLPAEVVFKLFRVASRLNDMDVKPKSEDDKTADGEKEETPIDLAKKPIKKRTSAKLSAKSR